MKESLFQPYVMVNDKGMVSIDWTGSYVQTNESNKVDFETLDESGHAERLDQILGVDMEISESDKLRRLADYMDAFAG